MSIVQDLEKIELLQFAKEFGFLKGSQLAWIFRYFFCYMKHEVRLTIE